MKRSNHTILLLLPVVIAQITGCINYKVANPKLVEKLNSQIKAEQYESIYNESSYSAKTYKYSKEQFIERLKAVREKINGVDESLEFQQPQGICGDEGVYRDDNFACRFMEKNGRRLDISFWLDANDGGLKLLDLCVYSDEMDGTYCVSDASRS